MRLDYYLFQSGLVQSRQKAQELIESLSVFVNGRLVNKNSFEISSNASIVFKEQKQWVARSGEKLYRFLLSNEISVEGREILDIGSSTGGFSEVLLHLGAKKITCVDVGSNQLHQKLRQDSKISFFENQDIRTFKHAPFELVVCDVSFISLSLLIDKIYDLTAQECILLFKPQFEVGRGVKRNKKGVIIQKESIQEALEKFLFLSKQIGFRLKICEMSAIKGKNGNEEYFIYLSKA